MRPNEKNEPWYPRSTPKVLRGENNRCELHFPRREPNYVTREDLRDGSVIYCPVGVGGVGTVIKKYPDGSREYFRSVMQNNNKGPLWIPYNTGKRRV